MNKLKLNKVIQEGNIVIPIYILKFYKKLNLLMEEFVFLMYLYNRQDNLDFNPEKISVDLNIDIMEVMGYISILVDKGYLTLDVKKDENNILEEFINLSNFYEKISYFLINSEEVKLDSKTSLVKDIKDEYGRELSEFEVSTIYGWLDNNIKEELIKEAVKIAINDGVYNLKLVDKILFEWNQKGIKCLDDIKNNNDNINSNDEIEVFDWNWLDDESEYIIN